MLQINAPLQPTNAARVSSLLLCGCSYYHGKISREDAVKRLQTRNLDGAFLLRMSATQDGVYTISLQCVCAMCHSVQRSAASCC